MISICSIKTRSRKWDIFEKQLQHIPNPYEDAFYCRLNPFRVKNSFIRIVYRGICRDKSHFYKTCSFDIKISGHFDRLRFELNRGKKVIVEKSMKGTKKNNGFINGGRKWICSSVNEKEHESSLFWFWTGKGVKFWPFR